MDQRIKDLPSTTFCGKRLTRKQIANIQETVAALPQLSRHEVGQTICEHLGWRTAAGDNRIALAQRLLEELERLGIVSLPALNSSLGRGRPRRPQPTPRTAPQPAIEDRLADLTPLTLQVVTAREAVAEWNEWVQRYHPLGYRHPLGPGLRYFLRDRRQRLLGCLLFGFAATRVRCRDAWIGWPLSGHRPHLDHVVGNARFLLLPWVRVKCLASKALALAARQLPADWQRVHGVRPVLLETFVDLRRHPGTCYRAANWQFLGRTKGAAATARTPARTPKGVFVYPLQRDWREVLLEGPRKVAARRKAHARGGQRALRGHVAGHSRHRDPRRPRA